MKIAEMSEENATWVAGLLDGEGSFVRVVDKRHGHHVSCRLQCEMTDEDTIQKLTDVCGGNKNGPYVYGDPRFKSIKPRWRWHMTRQKDVFDLLLRIGPYLSSRRREQAGILFNYLESKVVS